MKNTIPICRHCKKRQCQKYGGIGGYSVQCKRCNEAQGVKRRAASKKLREERKSNHSLCHAFADWILARQAGWLGTRSGLETFVSWKAYSKTYFREWAITTNLPRKRWEAVYREYVND